MVIAVLAACGDSHSSRNTERDAGALETDRDAARPKCDGSAPSGDGDGGYPGQRDTFCQQFHRDSEIECDGTIFRFESHYSQWTTAWDAETLKLVGYEYCSDDTTQFGKCGPCKGWGVRAPDTPEGRAACIPRDPCAELDPPTWHAPVCAEVGTDTEGWYWADTHELIAEGPCHYYAAWCEDAGSDDEGWHLFGPSGETTRVPDPMCHCNGTCLDPFCPGCQER